MLCKNCGREMPMIGKNCPFCGASTLLSRPPKKTANTNANDETTFFIPLSEDGHADLSAFREALQGHRPAEKPEETTPEMTEMSTEELEAAQTAHAQTAQTEQQTMPPSPPVAPVQTGQQQAAPRPRTAPAPAGQQQAAPRPRTAPAQAGQQQAAPRPRTAPAQAGQRQAAPRPQTAPAQAQMQPAYDVPTGDTPRREAHSRKKTAYYDPETNDIRPYRKRSLAQRIITKLCIIVALAGIVGGGIYYVRSKQPDENLVAAEKYMDRGQFENALHAFQQALSTAKDPAAIQLQIDQLKSYQQADDFLKDKDYSSAITTLNDLKGRLTDAGSPLVEAVDELLTTAQSERAKATKTPDTSDNNPDESDNPSDDTSTDKPDDTTSSDNDNDKDDDTSSSQNHTTEPTQNDNENNEEQEAAARQEELEQEKRNQQQSFSRQIGTLESNDEQISSAQDAAEQLEKTSLSFEAWDTMLASLYDSLATVTSADEYAEEEQNYQQWIAERDQGAANAASEKTDSEEAQLAAAQFKQSYTKTQCYKILDKLSE